MNVRVWMLALLIAAAGAPLACGMEITGQIVDSSARPVEGAEVAVYEEYWVNRSETHGRLASPIVRTDRQGRFELQANVGRQRNTYIVARGSGLASAWAGLNGSHRYVLGKGHFLLVLQPPCVLDGQLVDANGKPIAQARVQALPFSTSGDTTPILAPQEWFTTTTDASGHFRFAQFAPDVSARFRVNVPGSTNTNVFTTHTMGGCGFEVWRSDIRLELPREGTIQGRIVDNGGKPIGGVDLVIGPHPGSQDFMSSYLFRKTRSCSDGTFAFSGIPEGLHQIHVVSPEQGVESWVGSPTEVLLEPGQAAADATIHVTRGGLLEVTALDAQTRQPLPAMKVFAFGQDWRRDKPALTDASGMARLRVPAGNFTLAIQSTDIVDCQGAEQVADGQTLPYPALVRIKPEFTGRVIDPTDRPVTDAAVTIHPFGDHVYTDDGGRFTGHADGEYGAQGGIVVARDINTGLALAMPVADWSKSTDLPLAPALTLTGKIVDPNGVGIDAAHVTLDISLDVQRCLSNLGVKALTDSQGRFEMKAIPPVQGGFHYTLSVSAPGYGSRLDPSIPVIAAPGEKADIGTFELTTADQSVSGVVVDASGEPAPHTSVTLTLLAGAFPPLQKSTVTNAKGEFGFRGLCKGPIRIQAGTGTVQAELPVRDVRITLGQERTIAAESPILSRSLPSLTDVSATLSAAQIDGKAVLMCFMDIQQRPCRQCLTELAGRAEALSSEGIALLVVQVGAVNMVRYETWLKQNNVTLDIHVAADDFATRQSAWGIKGLPWLILADAEHIVRAEGLPLADLDKALDDIK